LAFFIKLIPMRNFVEHVVNVPLAIGDTSKTIPTALPSGKIIAVAAFYDQTKFPGITRASIKDFSGMEVSKMQDIRNLRDREAGYLEGKKPLFLDGGTNASITVQPTSAITDASSIDFVFVYANEN
jgi:hypothetical protein